MNGNVVNFGDVTADVLPDGSLIGLDNNGHFELHEIITKTIEVSGRVELVICRSFLNPEMIATLSFWTDMDKKIFVPLVPASIKDFVIIDAETKNSAGSAGQADLSHVAVLKEVVFYGEKTMANGKIKFALVHRSSKGARTYECISAMSGNKLNRSNTMTRGVYRRIDLDVERLKRLGFKEKNMPTQGE
jgi:hypothetical protein